MTGESTSKYTQLEAYMQEQEIVQSKLLAKAVLISGDQVEIIAVFEKSEYFKCFFTFTADKPNAKQEDWKRKGFYSIYAGTYLTLDEFVAREIRNNFKGDMIFVETKLHCTRNELIQHLDRVAHPYQYIKRVIPKGATFDLINRKVKAAMKPAGFWFNSRNKHFDTLPTSISEVLVYDDFCPDCGNRHSIAHFPAGNTKCMDMTVLQRNPGLEYSGHKDGIFRFRHRVTF